MNRFREGLMRSLIFFDVIEHVPTYAEWIGSWHSDGGVIPTRAELDEAAQQMIAEGVARCEHGCVVLGSSTRVNANPYAYDEVLPRKQRRLRWILRWLRLVPGVRAVFLCNSTGFLNATDTSDLDFFVIVRQGAMWQARLLATLPFLLLRLRPGDRREERDAVCLSFFVSDQALDLAPLMIERDVYMAHWFRSLIPLFDDGAVRTFWEANTRVRSMLPCGALWQQISDQPATRHAWQFPRIPCVESAVRWLQRRHLPYFSMKHATSVVITDQVLKFHADDARLSFRDSYELQCHSVGIHP